MRSFIFALSVFFSVINYSVAQPQVKIDSLKILLESAAQESEERLNLLNQIGFEYWTIDPSQSEEYGQEAATLAMVLNDSGALALSHRVIGVSHWSRGNSVAALKHLFKSQAFYQSITDKLGQANCLMNIGLVFSDQIDYKNALEYFFDAKILYEQLNAQERLGTVSTKIGSVYIETGNNEDADKYLSNSLAIHRSLDYQFGIMEATNRFGLLELNRGNKDKAEDYLNESLAIARENKDQEHIIKNLENLARVYLGKNEVIPAMRLLDEAYPLAQTRQYKKWLRDILHDYRQIHLYKKDFEKALFFSDQYERLKDSLFNEEKAAQLASLKMEQEETEQRQLVKLQEQEIAILQQKKKINQLSMATLISTLVVVIIGSILIIRIQRTRYKKKNKEVREDLERARQIERELKETLHFKDKELTSYTMNFIRKNELIEELGAKVKGLMVKLPEQSRELNAIINLVQNNNIDKDWEDFKAIFENVHQGFFGKLLRQYPELTPNELKLCALIQLNLSIKEMASLMGISPDSIKTSRYRLRKKLGLSQDRGLSKFMMDFT